MVHLYVYPVGYPRYNRRNLSGGTRPCDVVTWVPADIRVADGYKRQEEKLTDKKITDDACEDHSAVVRDDSVE